MERYRKYSLKKKTSENKNQMESLRILIVEDEILIADMIKRYLVKEGHQVIGTAISFEEAVHLYSLQKPDIALLDIRLSGPKTGIDFAQVLRKEPQPIPFIYLTSQMDKITINKAKETLPAGYLTKPIQKYSLYTTIEIAMHNHVVKKGNKQNITLADGTKKYQTNFKDILYLQADHIYVKVNLQNGMQILQRGTLKELMEQLPSEKFIQTHRSFVINTDHVDQWDTQNIYIKGHEIPLSRSRRKTIFALLK